MPSFRGSKTHTLEDQRSNRNQVLLFQNRELCIGQLPSNVCQLGSRHESVVKGDARNCNFLNF